MEELVIPVEPDGTEEAKEFIRFWIAGGKEYISLNVGMMGENEAKQWGMMLADLASHVVRALQQDGSLHSDEALLAEIERGYLGRIKSKMNHTGSLLGSRN